MATIDGNEALKCADCERSDSRVTDLQPTQRMEIPSEAIIAGAGEVPHARRYNRRTALVNGVGRHGGDLLGHPARLEPRVGGRRSRGRGEPGRPQAGADLPAGRRGQPEHVRADRGQPVQPVHGAARQHRPPPGRVGEPPAGRGDAVRRRRGQPDRVREPAALRCDEQPALHHGRHRSAVPAASTPCSATAPAVWARTWPCSRRPTTTRPTTRTSTPATTGSRVP